MRRLKSWWWLAKSVYDGRLYYADGGSGTFPRSFVWSSLRPRPVDWLKLRAMRWPILARPEPCGCVYWRWSTEPELICSDHLFNKLLPDRS